MNNCKPVGAHPGVICCQAMERLKTCLSLHYGCIEAICTLCSLFMGINCPGLGLEAPRRLLLEKPITFEPPDDDPPGPAPLCPPRCFPIYFLASCCLWACSGLWTSPVSSHHTQEMVHGMLPFGGPPAPEDERNQV